MTNTQPIEPRLDYAKAAPGANAAMYTVERYVRECGLERGLLELVKLRAAISGWNRLAISFRAVAGTYQPGTSKRGTKEA